MIGRRRGQGWWGAWALAMGIVVAMGFTLTATHPSAVSAQDSQHATADESKADSAADGNSSIVLRSHSWLAWLSTSLGPLYGAVFLFLSFSLVALIVVNVVAIRRDRIAPERLVQTCYSYLDQKRPQEAIEVAKADDSLLGRALAAGLARLPGPLDQAAQAMEDAGAGEALRLEHQLGYLGLIAQVAPLVGLLGTVDGLAQAFEVIATHNQMPKPQELAQGIGVALVATIVSLWIAIPAVVGYNILRARLARLLFDAGAVSDSLLKRCVGQK